MAVHKNLPPEIKIGAFTYRIVREPEVAGLAQTRHADLDILIAENIALPLAALLMWREVLGIIKTYWTEAALTNGLMTVFRDNPEILSWTTYVLHHNHDS